MNNTSQIPIHKSKTHNSIQFKSESDKQKPIVLEFRLTGEHMPVLQLHVMHELEPEQAGLQLRHQRGSRVCFVVCVCWYCKTVLDTLNKVRIERKRHKQNGEGKSQEAYKGCLVFRTWCTSPTAPICV